MEVPLAGRVGKLGELYDFPQNLGHFASVFVGVEPENIFALGVSEPIPQASIIPGDVIIFDTKKKPQPGDICIAPIGERFFLIRVDSKTYDRETHSFETRQGYPIPEELTNPELGQLLNWYPLAYDETTEIELYEQAQSQNWPIGAIPLEYVVATALRLTRQLAF